MTFALTRRRSRTLFLAFLLSACDSASSSDAMQQPSQPDRSLPNTTLPDTTRPQPDAGFQQPGVDVDSPLSAADTALLTQLRNDLASADGLTREGLLQKRAVRFANSLGYDPESAKNMDLIQASALRLNEAELAKLAAQGFVITPRNQFPNMVNGYKTIYAADLPVYISLDSILDAVHVSYDAILKSLEMSVLTADLKTLLSGALSNVKAGADNETNRDLDIYFTVALSLLEDKLLAPAFSQNADAVQRLFELSKAAEGIQRVTLFGNERDYDFSQLKPRGHYTDSFGLQQYFRATMWLGRTDFRLIDTQPDGSEVFRRRQFDVTLALAAVVQGPARAAYDRLDQAIGTFVGAQDYMTLAEVDKLVADLGGSAALAQKSDDEIAQVIVEKGYGAQQIASQVMAKAPTARGTLPLARSFALLGQRYVVDSHVFSNVVFDRVEHEGKPKRMLPNPLDVAYGALGNPAALPLLSTELDTYGYAPDLEKTRMLVDAHGASYWDQNLYTLWLSALRAISPAEGAQDPSAQGKPNVTGSEPWSRRMLNTQLGSWAELRHDTILYAKQSYTLRPLCEFPDGYVDPYPEAYARLAAFAKKGQETAALFTTNATTFVRQYFEELQQVMEMLQSIAEHQKSGLALDAAQLAFINDAVRSQIAGCTADDVSYQGWYKRLLYSTEKDDMDPGIADVHTDPGGDHPPKVLHVATGLPRMMVVTRESCSGPRAYVGLAFAYHEKVTGLERLNDVQWAPLAPSAEDVAFMKPILP